MIGKTFSHYRILSRLGEGGMGEVWLAEDVRLGHKVAIKKLPRHLASDRQLRKRFEHEARAVAHLRHPYVVPLYEYNENEGELFLVTEYLSRGSIRDVLRDNARPLDVGTVLRWGIQAAEGLAEAHQRGILHRDIKPDNLLLTEDGDLRIADFGLARLEGATRLTQTGTSMGTLGYMAPEQVEGEDADHRADLFALGATLYEMLAGRPAFHGETRAALVRSILDSDPEPLTAIRTDVPDALSSLVQTLTEKSPAKRMDSAKDVANSLRSIANVLDLAETMPLPVSVGRPRRRPLLSRWILTAAATVVIGSIAWRVLSDRGGSPEVVSYSPNRIAVFPFNVRGADDWLREGMVDLLSSKLDGAGELQTVDIHSLLALLRDQGQESLDLRTARFSAQRAKAGLFILGNATQAGERLHLDASLYGVASLDSVLARSDAEGSEEDLLTLVDELSGKLLKARFEEDAVSRTLGESINTKSYKALKSFLQGEQLWRQQQATNSTPYFEEAVRHDSTFAFAWLRLAIVYEWKPASVRSPEHDSAALDALAHARRNFHRLSIRHQLWLDAYETQVRKDYEQSIQLFEALLARYPDDVEGWDRMGAIQEFFNAWRTGQPVTSAKPALERALELDPEYTQANFHMRHIRIVEADGNPDDLTELLPNMAVFARNDPGGQASLLNRWSQASDSQLNGTQYLAFFTKNFKGAEMATELRLDPKRHPEARGLGHVLMGFLAAAQGEWDRAKSHLDAAASLTPTLELERRALLAGHPFLMVPAGELREIRERVREWNPADVPPLEMELRDLRIHDGTYPQLRIYLLGLLSLRLGELDAVARYADDLVKMDGSSREQRLFRDLSRGLYAQKLWQEGRLEEALDRFQEAEMKAGYEEYGFSPYYFQSLERYLRAELLLEMGHLEEALRWFGTFNWYPSWEFLFEPHSHLRRGQIYERLGNTEAARAHYERFVRDWNECDARLAPEVVRVRRWLQEQTSG